MKERLVTEVEYQVIRFDEFKTEHKSESAYTYLVPMWKDPVFQIGDKLIACFEFEKQYPEFPNGITELRIIFNPQELKIEGYSEIVSGRDDIEKEAIFKPDLDGLIHVRFVFLNTGSISLQIKPIFGVQEKTNWYGMSYNVEKDRYRFIENRIRKTIKPKKYLESDYCTMKDQELN